MLFYELTYSFQVWCKFLIFLSLSINSFNVRSVCVPPILFFSRSTPFDLNSQRNGKCYMAVSTSTDLIKVCIALYLQWEFGRHVYTPLQCSSLFLSTAHMENIAKTFFNWILHLLRQTRILFSETFIKTNSTNIKWQNVKRKI